MWLMIFHGLYRLYICSNQEKQKENLDEIESYSRREYFIISNIKPMEGKIDEEVFGSFVEITFPI